jgi:hypothetical protein
MNCAGCRQIHDEVDADQYTTSAKKYKFNVSEDHFQGKLIIIMVEESHKIWCNDIK